MIAPAPAWAEYDPGLFPTLRSAQDRHFWFLHRNAVIARQLRAMCRQWDERSRVLEVGCGTGNTLRVLERECQPATVIGLDCHAEGLEIARKVVDCQLVEGDIRDIPLPGSFDLIAAFDVIEHLPDDRDVLASLRARLNGAGGKLLLTVPAYHCLWSYFDEAACHCRRYTARSLRTVLEQAGYRVESCSYFMAPIFPAVWLARRLAAIKGRMLGSTIAELTRDEFAVVPE